MFICQYCNKESKIQSNNSLKNHESRCPENKKRVYKNGMTGKKSWNNGHTKHTCEITLKSSIALKEYYTTNPPTGCANWTSEQRSKEAKKQGFGGYRENSGRSKKYYVDDSNGKNTCLQSSYELRCATILDELNIHWIRPKHLKYTIDGTVKKYFPDFYLKDYDVYLDPKNDFLITKDTRKIQLVCEQNNVNVMILSNDNLTQEAILMAL